MKSKKNFVLIMVVYLLGIFMGALDTGIVTPARNIIQNSLGVDSQVGIWMITVYTLAYAASIPIMGKLADKFGRKKIYLTSILLFGIGSVLCGLSQTFESFGMLLVARVVQAIGGGGILPVATAEFGTTFPKEKRGMALGLVGGVFGIANIFGASVGSAILDIFGHQNWQYIFYVNVPITIFIIIAGILVLENNKQENNSKLDILGICTLTVMITSLLYGLTNLDFFKVLDTIINVNVYGFLALFILLIPLFIFIEKKADDPVINLKYFTNKNILITLIISLISGIVMMGMIFVPQFSENALKVASGSGGYFVIILGFFAGLASPFSGKLIDKFGAKIILAFGFGVSIIGALFLIFVTTEISNIFTVSVCLILIGIGIGFTMGSPLNYMMLANTEKKESNSALATLSLVRSIGTAVAPAIMVGFLAAAGTNVQANVMKVVQDGNNISKTPYSEKANYEMAEDMVNVMQTSDVTTIVKNTKMISIKILESSMKDKPQMLDIVKESIVKNIDSKKQKIESTFQSTLNEGFKNIYLTSLIAALIALTFLAFYSKEKEIS